MIIIAVLHAAMPTPPPASAPARRPRRHPARRLIAAAGLSFMALHAPDALAAQDAPGASFAREARVLFDLVACARPPVALDAAREEVVRRHCRAQRGFVSGFIEGWLRQARPFFRANVPSWLPDEVLYPFGGSDLLTLLAVFPRARTFTSISLEASGDPRELGGLEAEALDGALQMHRERLARQLRYGHSRTDNLLLLTRGPLSSELSFNLVALVVHGCEPVDLRYFEVLPDGTTRTIRRAEAHEMDALHPDRPTARRTALRQLFSHMDLSFRCRDDPGRVRRYRHIRADLSDRGLAARPGIAALLRRQPASAGMLKAGSYLIQMSNFRTIRALMLERCDWMISDATGPLPSQAEAAGFWQETFGTYAGSFLMHARGTDQVLRALWHTQPLRPLPIRFGYPDNAGRAHLVITRRRRLPRRRALCRRGAPGLAEDGPTPPLATAPGPKTGRRAEEPGPGEGSGGPGAT